MKFLKSISIIFNEDNNIFIRYFFISSNKPDSNFPAGVIAYNLFGMNLFLDIAAGFGHEHRGRFRPR
jgi:hypothetical protein